jgi:hypothetical protein
MKYATLPTVKKISGQMTVSMSISSIRFLLMAFACRVKTKCSWSRLARLSSWCITWRWPLDMIIICLRNKEGKKLFRNKASIVECHVKIYKKGCHNIRIIGRIWSHVISTVYFATKILADTHKTFPRTLVIVNCVPPPVLGNEIISDQTLLFSFVSD